MKIYPAIDLIEGKLVRLSQGRFDQQTSYSQSPLAAAQDFADQGAEYLHVVDLDGARHGRPMQLELLKALATRLQLKLQVGGGIRSLEHVASLIQAGVDRVIIGSLALQDYSLCQQIFETFGAEHITLGLDIVFDTKGEAKVATQGWQEISSVSADELLERYLGLGLNQVLCTDIHRDGMMAGPNFAFYKTLVQRFPQLCLLASGGVHSVADIRQLKADGIGGAIIGKALYEGSFTLREALQC